MSDVKITKINNTYMKIICKETYMEFDIQDKFSFEVEGAKFSPAFKYGNWDGIKKLFNRKTKKLYVGLLLDLIELCDKKGWSTDIDNSLLPNEDILSDEDLQNLIEHINPKDDNGNTIELYHYQFDAVKYMINMDRTVCLSATSSGKSLIIYIAMRIYQLMEELQHKTIFITVPTKILVEQLYGDFENYSTDTEWHVTKHCQKISGKYEKFVNKQVVITTWQSMEKLPHDDFENIGAVFIDECVHPDSEITMSDNSKKLIKDINVSDTVMTVNEGTGELEPNKVLKVHKNLSREPMYKITVNGNTLRISGNHKMFTKRGWVRADELREDDEIRIC